MENNPFHMGTHTIALLLGLIVVIQPQSQEVADYRSKRTYAHNPTDTTQKVLIAQEKRNDCGQIVEEINYQFDDLLPFDSVYGSTLPISAQKSFRYTYENDCQPTEILILDQNGTQQRQISYEYFQSKIFETQEHDGMGRLLKRTEYYYEGPEGKLSAERTFNDKNQNIEIKQYKYNSAGLLAQEIQITPKFQDTVTIYYLYDRNGQLIERSYVYANNISNRTITYAEGKLISERLLDAGGRTIELRTGYDEQGRISTWQEWDLKDEKLLKYFSYEYD